MGLLLVSTQLIYAQESPAFNYVTPVRWLKPGVLLLEQQDILRGGEGKDVYHLFTVKFGDQPGKFQIISKKKVPSKEQSGP